MSACAATVKLANPEGSPRILDHRKTTSSKVFSDLQVRTLKNPSAARADGLAKREDAEGAPR